MEKRLGYGRHHAGFLYKEWMRKGTCGGSDPAFANAGDLLCSLLEQSDFSHPELIQTQSGGEASKFLLKASDGLEMESVMIAMKTSGTLCISSQVGCRMGCAFCETGRMGLLRNLTAAEIVSQVFVARHRLNFDFNSIVFMGMGEPLDNYEEVMQAIRILADPQGLGFGVRRLTVSTSGCVDKIYRLMDEELVPNLAVSVNAPRDDVRMKLMPVNRQYNMEDLYRVMDEYGQRTGREILVEYVLIKDKTDALSDADDLALYLRGLNVRVNLIPYNSQSKHPFTTPDDSVIEAFFQRMRSHGYLTFLRRSKGQKVMAACGQLGNRELRKSFLINKSPC